jgi:hypothetical protein
MFHAELWHYGDNSGITFQKSLLKIELFIQIVLAIASLAPFPLVHRLMITYSCIETVNSFTVMVLIIWLNRYLLTFILV